MYKNLKLKNNELDDPMISYVSIDEHEISQFSIFVMSIFLVTWDLILTWPAQILAHFQMLECYINMCYIYFGTVPGNEILYYMLEWYINMTYSVHIFWGCWNVILLTNLTYMDFGFVTDAGILYSPARAAYKLVLCQIRGMIIN